MEAIPRTLIQSQTEVAAALGISDRSLRAWEHEAWFPPSGRTAEGYDIEAIRDARDAAGLAAAGERAAELRNARQESSAYRAAKARLAKAHRLLNELKLEKLNGEVRSRLEIDSEISRILTAARDAFEQLPAVVGRMCCRECRRKFEATLQELLEPRQFAFGGALEQSLKDYDARAAGDEAAKDPPEPSGDEAGETITDALMSERVAALLVKAELAERRFSEQAAALFPVAALRGLAELCRHACEIWPAEIPSAAASSCCCKKCRGRVREELRDQLEGIWEAACGGMDRLSAEFKSTVSAPSAAKQISAPLT